MHSPRNGVVGAVGHVERFNSALQEMKRRLVAGDLGRVIAVSTERVGPFPHRIQDVGVVKDLATHDIDIVTWIGGAPFLDVGGHLAHKMGRPHEDLMVAVGRLENDVVASMNVNWLTPMKRRTVVALGERGAFEANLLTGDLRYYANGDVDSEWDQMAILRGVSEGDMIQYALVKREPLAVEHEAFQEAVKAGGAAEGVVSLDDGVAILARRGGDHRRGPMRVAVVALGKIGLPLAAQIASKGWTVVGADISEQVVDLINAGRSPFPGETGLEELLAGAVRAGLLTATTDTAAAVSESDHVVVVVPLMTDRVGVADFAAMDAATAEIARGLQPGTLVSYETTLPVGSTRLRFKPALEAATGLEAGKDFFLVHSPERVFSGRVFQDLRRYPKLVGGVDFASTQRGVEFYTKILDFDRA